MTENKTSVSKQDSYSKIGEFWDKNDLADFWEETQDAEFENAIDSQTYYFALDSKISPKLNEIAVKRGVSPESLINRWLKEKVDAELK